MNNLLTPEFVANLDNWLSKNELVYSRFLENYSAKIPSMLKNGKKLYRGMEVSKDFLNDVKKGTMVFKNPTSWSTDKKTAIKFASDSKFKLSNFSKKDSIKILLTKEIPTSKIILDIFMIVKTLKDDLEDMGMDELSIDSALNEFEVLVKSNLKIEDKDISYI